MRHLAAARLKGSCTPNKPIRNGTFRKISIAVHVRRLLIPVVECCARGTRALRSRWSVPTAVTALAIDPHAIGRFAALGRLFAVSNDQDVFRTAHAGYYREERCEKRRVSPLSKPKRAKGTGFHFWGIPTRTVNNSPTGRRKQASA
jgi:hypothetical protein